MAPRGYDRYMVVVGAGRNRKFVRLTDSERCAHFLGVLSIAAQSPHRGCLLVSDGEEASAEEVANEAAVTVRVARSAMDKLKRVGVLFRDDEAGAWRVHDWDEINPPPGSSTERVRRYRANQRNDAGTNGEPAGVTDSLQSALPEVEVEEELPASTTSQQVARKRATRQIDQTEPPENFPTDLLSIVDAVLSILHRVWDVRGGIEPMVRGVALGVLRNPRADHVRVALKLEQWLTAGNGRRAQCKDVCARFGDWVENEGAALRVIDGGTGRQSAGDLIAKLRAAEEAS